MSEVNKAYIRPEDRPVPDWNDHAPFEYVLDGLRSYAASDVYPFHMPGHKRNTKKFGQHLNLGIDMTESEGMENLHDPSGPILRHTQALAKKRGAQRSFYMVNGSTGGILAAIRTATRRGDTIIVGRNAHKSTYHAIEIGDLNPVFISPEIDEDFGIYGSISPQTMTTLLEQHPETTAVIITSPTFEGVFSDIRALSQLCHARGVLLLVDQAHGAHTCYCSRLTDDAVLCGADIVIESLHKTLPSLTGTSLLHISERVDADRMAHNLSVFQTTSPSHLLMASIDECISYLDANGISEHNALFCTLDEFSERLKGLRTLRVLGVGSDSPEQHPTCFSLDPTKIVISTRFSGFSGMTLMERLRRDHRIELEMAYGTYAMAMATIGDTREGLMHFANALLQIDAELSPVEGDPLPAYDSIPRRALRVLDAMEAERYFCPLSDALDKISAEYAWAYPPGIPLLTPGERISEHILSRFALLEAQGVHIKTDCRRMPAGLMVVKD